MLKLRPRTKVSLLIAAALLLLFAWSESYRGQRYLQGPTPPSTGNPQADAFAADDRAMGAGIAPFVYALAPGIAALAFAVAFIATDILRIRQHLKEQE
jgi:hypothetical protein